MSRLVGHMATVVTLTNKHTLFSSFSTVTSSPMPHTQALCEERSEESVFVDYFSSCGDICVAFVTPVILTHLHFGKITSECYHRSIIVVAFEDFFPSMAVVCCLTHGVQTGNFQFRTNSLHFYASLHPLSL